MTEWFGELAGLVRNDNLLNANGMCICVKCIYFIARNNRVIQKIFSTFVCLLTFFSGKYIISLIDILYRISRSFPVIFALLLYIITITNHYSNYSKDYLICKNAYIIIKLASSLIFKKLSHINYIMCAKRKKKSENILVIN